MLRRHYLEQSRQRQQLLKKFDSSKSTWIVSDLKSKLAIQKSLLERSPFLEEDGILRASELWRKLLFRIRPEWKLVSHDLAISLIEQILSESEYAWARSAGASARLLEFMSLFVGVYSHPEGFEQMGEWFRLNPMSYVRWGEWFIEGHRTYLALESKKLFPSSWAPSLLLSQNLEGWSRSLLVDLGPDLNLVEAELFHRLSQKLEVTVLQPRTSWSAAFPSVLSAYTVFANAQGDELATADAFESSITNCFKFSTQLSEVKHATALTRQAIDAGIAPHRIAIVAPDIKVYWRALDLYLRQEGVPVSQERGAVLTHFVDFSTWFSELNLRGQSLSSEDLEASLYSSQSHGPLSYGRFQSLFSRIYGDEDFMRDKLIADVYKNKLREKDMTRDQFIFWSAPYFPVSGDHERFENFLKTIIQECPRSMTMSAKAWIRYLNSRASRTDVMTVASEVGVDGVNIDSAEDGTYDVMIFLGLTETGLRESENTMVDRKELMSISSRTGFAFPYTDPARLDFKTRWISQSQKQQNLLVSMSDFDGNTTSPSLFWLEQAQKHAPEDAPGSASEHLHKVLRPWATSWDNLQSSGIETIATARGWTSNRKDNLFLRLQADLGEEQGDLFPLNEVSHISASSLEEFYKCPFRFAARKIFCLEELPEIDLDVDPMSRGRLIHRIFEKLLAPPLQLNQDEEDILRVIDEARLELAIDLGDVRFWNSMRKGLLKTSQKFLAFELEWRKKFPETETIGREVRIEGHVNLKTGGLSRTASEHSVKVLGSIDRVDTDREGNAVVLDYKASAGELKQVGSWLENHQLQLLFYTAALEAGLTPLGAQTVIGAFYFVTRSLDRNRGFKLLEKAGSLFNVEDRAQNKITPEKKEELLSRLRELFVEFGVRSRKGDFLPNPIKPDICIKCDWNQICRAPHLN